MSLQAVRNVVLLFSNPTWSGGHSVPSTILRNITALSSQIAYSEDIFDNITTLSTNYASPVNGVIQGLLYVPDIDKSDPCHAQASKYVPSNVTRQVSLPATNYRLIAVAPWISVECTQSFFASARIDPLRAMLVYRPDDGNHHPPEAGSEVWNLEDGEKWKRDNHYPVYAIPGTTGTEIMRQLSLYSGDLTEVPYAAEINANYSPNPADYVRMWTELTVSTGPAPVEVWAFVLIIIAVLLFVIGGTSLLMHYVQNRRRAALRRRVMRGEVNLEALGIKRLKVPIEHIHDFPLFTYNYDPAISSPGIGNDPGSPPGRMSSRDSIGKPREDRDSLHYQPTCLICLDEFESKKTIIRELSCGHIFHPECIDEFLTEVSSLCPICKTSMLPLGHCPRITNSMVRREFSTRRLRSHGTLPPIFERGRRRFLSWIKSFRERLSRTASAPKIDQPFALRDQRPVIQRPRAPVTVRDRMQDLVEPIDESNSDDGRPRWKQTALKVFPGFG